MLKTMPIPAKLLIYFLIVCYNVHKGGLINIISINLVLYATNGLLFSLTGCFNGGPSRYRQDTIGQSRGD